MKPCPCINCLVFPICKVQVYEYMKKYYPTIERSKAQHHYNITTSTSSDVKKVYGSIVYTNVLKLKCSLIADWINRPYLNNLKYYTIIYNIYKIKPKDKYSNPAINAMVNVELASKY